MATAAENPTQSPAVAKGIQVSDRALVRIRAAMAKENVSPTEGGLRLGVQGGGCSGLTYNIRFGLGRFNTDAEVDYVADRIVDTVAKLRELSPLYEMAKEGIDLSKVQWQTEGHS